MKNWIRRIVDLGLYLSFCFMLGTGLLIQFKLVPGSRGGHGLTALGMGRHDWGELHFYAGLLFVGLVIAHLVMSWGWLVRVAAGKKLWPVLLGLLLGVLTVSAIYFQPIEHKGNNRSHESEEH
jgi:hypothetical protein